ncbi:MAG TPA: hypothetical protein DD400_04245, partial [Rhodospirillaceae bacterium]|nr:hypothetical protein [Rhodospirillaceae bacterium]
MRTVFLSVFITVIVTVLVALLLQSGVITFPEKTSATASKESVYDRVLRTETIRCGYSVWKPLMWVDPNSNKKMGIFPDLMEEIGRRLGLKIVWQEELGWGMVVESVKTGRVDMA